MDSTSQNSPGGRLPRAERRQQLIEVARRVFAGRGFEAATLEEIAEQAGISRPILYSHFGDKQGLFEAVVAGEISRVEAVIAESMAGPGDTRELVERGMRSFFQYVQEHPEGHAVLTRDAPVHMSDTGLGLMLDSLATRISDVIADGLRSFDLDPAPAPIFANSLIGVGSHVGRWWREHPEVSLETVTAHTVALLWNGLGGLVALAEQGSTPR